MKYCQGRYGETAGQTAHAEQSTRYVRAQPKRRKYRKKVCAGKVHFDFLGGEVNIYCDAAGVRAAEKKLLL